jgi:hypothetical protein
MQEIDVCPVAAAFRRWEMRCLATLKVLRYAERASLFRFYLDDAPDALIGAYILADFHACAATAYEYEIWMRSEVPQLKGCGEFLTRLLPYCSLWSSGLALWVLTSQPHGADVKKYFVVSGDASFVQQLKTSNREECRQANVRHRVQRLMRARSVGAASRPTPKERISEVWSDTWVRPYESALSVLLKYMDENPTLASEWKQLVFAAGISNRSLLTGQGMLTPRPDIAAGEAVINGTLRAYGPRWRCRLTLAEQVRFCPDCRAQSYHCVFFQIRGLQICPMHRERLRDRCGCGAPTPSYDMVNRKRTGPFTCKECGEPVLETAPLKCLGDTYLSASYLELKLNPLVDWIRRAECTHLPDPPWRNRLPVEELIPHPENQARRPGWTSALS